MPEGDLSPTGKPTINDLARVAGVSLATVDRVLNGRPGVRRATIDKVNKAIADLGYIRDTAAANLARRRVYRLLFILPDAANEFVDALITQVSIQGAQLSHQRTILGARTVPPFDPQALVAMLDPLSPDEIDGVAVFGRSVIILWASTIMRRGEPPPGSWGGSSTSRGRCSSSPARALRATIWNGELALTRS